GATLTVSTTTAAAAGTFTLTITGTAASGSHTTTVSVTITAAGGACTTTTQLFGNPGFESGNTIWSSTPAVIDASTAGSAPRTGLVKAWLDGYGTTHTDDLWQTVTIPAGACSATLSFWLKITTSETTTVTAFDRLTVTVRNTAGTVLSTLATYSNLNRSTTYLQKTFDVTSFKGQTVRIQFHGTEDVSLQTSFFIDDTALTVVQ
ncbi:MAG TPA: serine protease, partial [Myxococcales bacterium]|nr:serine protease [Myxococcales bacterium]